MSAKKFLKSIVNLLFLGILSTVNALGITIDSCGESCGESADPADAVCLKDNKLYPSIAGSSNCIKDNALATMTTGYNVFSVNAATATAVTDQSTELTAGQLVLFQCISDTCQRGAGIVFVDNKYYSIPSEDVATDETDAITTTNTNQVIIVDKDSNEILKLPIGTAFPASASSEASYILKGKTGVITAAPFGGLNTSDNDNSGIVISTKAAISNTTPAMLVFNAGFNDEYCVTTSSSLITERPKNYCDGDTNDCDDYYTCTSGICVKTTTSYNRRGVEEPSGSSCDPITGENCTESDDGVYYYIGSGDTLASSATLITSATTGNLFVCTISGGSLTSCVKDTSMAGYIMNSDISNNLPIIKCTVGSSSNSCVALADAPASTVAACSENSSGIIVVGGIYNQCTDTDDDHATEISNIVEAGCVEDGDIIKEGGVFKICINGNKVIFDDGNYFIESDKASVFNDIPLENHYVAIDIDQSKALLNQDVTPKKYRYAMNDTRKINEKNGDASMCKGTPSTLDTDVAHEFVKVIEPEGSGSPDHVHYYMDKTLADQKTN